MGIKIGLPEEGADTLLKPKITVLGIGGAGGNAVNNMILQKLEGIDFVVANTDAQALAQAKTDRRIQLGAQTTEGLGAGARPDVGRRSADENIEQIAVELKGSHMAFITAGMGGGTGTGAAPVIAATAREMGILTVGVVTKPFNFEGSRRMRVALEGIEELSEYVDTLIVIPNQNLFRVANEKTTFADAFRLADEVLCSGVRGVTDLMLMPGLINLDFADIRTVMGEMGKAMMGTGEAEGENRAMEAAEKAISNPLLEDSSMSGARAVLINITGGSDMKLHEVDEAANRVRDEVDADANIIFGSTLDERLEGRMRVSVVSTGIQEDAAQKPKTNLFNVISKKEQPRTVPTPVKEPAAPMAAAPTPPPTPKPTPIQEVPELAREFAKVLAPTPTLAPQPAAAQAAAELPSQSDDAFIPEAAVEPMEVAPGIRSVAPVPRPEPEASADETLLHQRPEAHLEGDVATRGKSLFERVGLKRAHRMNAATATPGEEEETYYPVEKPTAKADGPAVQATLSFETDSFETDSPAYAEPDDEEIDIPAFLRRQAQ